MAIIISKLFGKNKEEATMTLGSHAARNMFDFSTMSGISAYIVVAFFLFVATACSNINKSINPEDSVDLDEILEYTDDTEYDDYKDGHVCISEDGRISIESGMVPDGGTAPDYWARWRIKDDKGKTHVMMYPETSYQNKVHAINKTDGTVFYIVNCYGKASSVDGYEWIQAYKIVGDTIQQVNVMDGSDDVGNHRFLVNYYIPSWYESTKGTGYDWVLDYDVHTRNLHVPITNDKRKIIDRYQVWHFDGNRFVYQGEKPHRNLHQSLADYSCLLCYATTKDYILRVDSTASMGLRYAAWKRPKTMADKPDIIITGGTKRHYDAAPDELRACDDYCFSNGSFEYVVNYCEVKMLENGLGEHHDFLLVRKNGNVVKKQELSR